VEAGILMALETPQGRADAMARSIEIFGRIMTAEEMLAELRAVDSAKARAAGQAMLAGPRAMASIGGKLALAA
jgi:predicted Zn-dependent peptidase